MIAEGNNINKGQEIEKVCALGKGRMDCYYYQARIETMENTLVPSREKTKVSHFQNVNVTTVL